MGVWGIASKVILYTKEVLMRPKLGYSNYHWINADRRKTKPQEDVKEVLEEAKPILNSSIDESLEELPEDDHTDFGEPHTSLLPAPVVTTPIVEEEPDTDLPRKEFKPLEEHTVLELRDICREKGIPQAGSKNELITKIRMH